MRRDLSPRAAPTAHDRHRRATFVRAMAIIAMVSAACGGAAAVPTAQGGSVGGAPLRVVASTTVLADLVRQVGGERVEVSSLVPIGGVVETFDPSPSDATRVAEAELIVINGLGLDDWARDLIEDTGSGDVPLLELAEDLEGVEYITGGGHEGEEEAHEGEEEAHEGEAVNPHLWLNVAYAQQYVERIGDALAATDPDDAAGYEAAQAAYLARLGDLDASIRDQMAAVPADNRRVVSFHEAFPYFARAYGLEIVGTVVDAPGQDPSAGEVAALVDAIRENGVKAIFSEVQFSDDLVATISAETGATVVSNLYNDSLGEPPVDTYEAMMRFDAEQIVAGLQ